MINTVVDRNMCDEMYCSTVTCLAEISVTVMFAS